MRCEILASAPRSTSVIGAHVQLDARGAHSGGQRVAELLVADRTARDLLGGAHVLPHVRHELVGELALGDAHDLQIEVEVRRLDVEEPADAEHPAEVARRDAAELAVVDPAEVGRALERDLAEAEPAQGVEHDRLQARDGPVEVDRGPRVCGLREHEPEHHRAAGVVERGATTRERPTDDLDAEPLARHEVEGAVDVVEPPDVQVRPTPDARLEDRHRRVARGAGQHGHLRVVLERVDRTAVDVPPGLGHGGRT